MVGAIISAAAGLGTALYGGIKAGGERKRAERYLKGQEADNQEWFNNNYYQNYIDRADTQALIKNMRNTLKKQGETDAARSAISGATPEAQLAAKEQQAKAVSDTYTNISAMGQQYKDGIMDKYLGRKWNLENQTYANIEQSAQSFENLMGNGIKLIGSGVSGLWGAKAGRPMQNFESAMETPIVGVSTPAAVNKPTSIPGF